MMQLGVVKSGKAARPRSADRGQAASLGVESASTQSAAPGGSSLSAGPSASDPRITPPSTTTPGAGANTASGSAEAIHLAGLAHSARPFQPVRIRGTYHGGANTFLRLQRWEEDKWLDFRVPTKTDQFGRFGDLGYFQHRLHRLLRFHAEHGHRRALAPLQSRRSRPGISTNTELTKPRTDSRLG
jgi:hypothetical protein